MIELYTAPTPEGWKVSVALEELGIPYVVHALEACHDRAMLPDFLRTSPCGCVPAIIDHDVEGACTVFEATAILLYLAEKTGRLLPPDPPGRARVMQWLMLRVDASGLRETHPVSSSTGSWSHPAHRKSVLGLFRVLDRQLQSSDYLAGDFSIADIAHWAWVRMYAWSGIDMTDLGALGRWVDRIAGRDACLRGAAVPRPFEPAESVHQVKSILLR